MALSRDSRQERKLKAVRRAQFALKQRLERIDFEEDVLTPEIEALKSGRSVLGLEDGTAFDIVVEHTDENRHPSPTALAPTAPARRIARSPRRCQGQ
jgi:hypothetical protein